MSQAENTIDMPANRSDRTLPCSLVVLIEVPELESSVDQANSPRPATSRISSHTDVKFRHPRRRLRREVRLAGCVLLALVPIVSACTLGWSNRPDRILACSISDPLASSR